MQTFRVTKYNPLMRTQEGFYLIDEWTSISDIGKNYNGKKFEIKEYIETEGKYIKVIVDYANFYKLENFVIRNFIKVGLSSNEIIQSFYSKELIRQYEVINENMTFSIVDLPQIMKLLLREDIYGKIVGLGTRFTIEFDYDYYMYVSVKKDHIHELQKIVLKNGLYLG